MRSTAAFVLAVLGCAACELNLLSLNASPPPQTSACVAGFNKGDVLAVRLGATYDATSSYLFEGSLGPPDFPNAPSCSGSDGLTTGTLVSFTLQSLEPSGPCGPWLASFSPETVGSHLVETDDWTPIDGVTIAVAYGAPPGDDTQVATRTLLTPGGKPDAAAIPRELPPIVVTRTLRLTSTAACHDEWIATWEPAP